MISVIFYKPETPIGKAIEVATGAKYAHVAFLMDDFHVIDINYNQDLSIRHLETSVDGFDIVKLNLTDIQVKKVKEFIYKYMGSDYDFLKAFGLGDNENKFTCYEVIYQALLYANYDIKLGVDMFIPDDLYNLLAS